MDYLYSLYDALVSINVPNDKARAVVDAMERDMGTTIATKTDLQMMSAATKADLRQIQAENKAELAQLRSDMATKSDLAALRQEFALLRKDMDVLSASVRKDMDALSASFRRDLELLSTTMTVRLGSMLMLGLGALFAALKLT